MRYIIYILVALSFSGCNPKNNNHVGIQLYGAFDAGLADTVARTIHDIYGYEVRILTSIPIPESTFTNQKSPRYRADELIKMLKENKPDTLDFILGLINKDISTTKTDMFGRTLEPASKYKDWGVFGLGYKPGVSCVVSTFRFQETNTDRFVDRLKKICIHEIGHNLGLDHCPNEDCVMRDAAESIKTIDEVRLNLCTNCAGKI